MVASSDALQAAGSGATFVKRAVALRAKYQMRDFTGSVARRLLPTLVGAHP